MRKLRQLVCSHEFEPQSVYADTGELFQKCQKCGKRVAADRVADSTSIT